MGSEMCIRDRVRVGEGTPSGLWIVFFSEDDADSTDELTPSTG